MTQFLSLFSPADPSVPENTNETLPEPLSSLLDLTPQERNLLLMRPLFQLEFSKNKYEGDGETPLFEGVDTHYLCLAALAYMMEGTAIAAGYTSTEVRRYLAGAAARMKPSLTAAQQNRIADIIVDTLDNASEKYKEHTCSFFHAPTGETQELHFRLTTYEPDLEDTYHYRPTAEGYLLLMGMLDMEVEDYQVLVERMLQLLIERGRFDQAYDFACRARMLSIEHRQHLRDFMHQAWRAPGSVLWERDIRPHLSEARAHIEERQEEDRRMEESVHTQLLQVDDPPTRERLAKLLEVLKTAAVIRVNLLTEVSASGDRFMDAQTLAFRPRKCSGLPDPETHLLPLALECPIERLAQHAEDLILSLYPPVTPRLVELSDLFALLLEHRVSNSVPVNDDTGEVIPFTPCPEPFPAEVTTRVHQWLDSQFALEKNWKLDALLKAAETNGFDALERQAVVYALYRSFPDSESLFPSVRAFADGLFTADVAQGDNLRFEPKESL